MKPAIFLDRDGTINEDRGYLGDPNQVVILAGVAEALTLLKEQGWPLVVISNQSGIGRGYYRREDLNAVQEKIEAALKTHGIIFNGTYFCPHDPKEKCGCRKPQPGLILQAAAEMDLDLKRSWMIGDKISDIEAGERAGCYPILINMNQNPNSHQEIPAGVVFLPDLLSAARYIVDVTA